MVLLHALRNHPVRVAHFNHQLRGAASNADQALVEQVARSMGAPCITDYWDQDKNAIRKLGLEGAARMARLKFLAETARQNQCRTVAMAHHADDQVETFFWRLFRGAGGSGLKGCSQITAYPGHPGLRIIRPFLDVRKCTILSYAKVNEIEYREDGSNAGLDHLRNRVRNQLLPHLREEFHPDVDAMVSQSMQLIDAEADYIRLRAAEWLESKHPEPFTQIHIAVQRQAIWLQLVQHGVEPSFRMIEHLRLQPGKPWPIDPLNTITSNEAGQLEVCPPSQAIADINPVQWQLRPGWNEAGFGSTILRCRIRDAGNKPDPKPATECFDADRVGERVTLRQWRAGDRFQPIGLKQASKLQDLFTNAKIPAAEKRHRVIACTAGGEIFWVEGLRIGEWAKIRPETSRFLEWHWAAREAA